MSVCAFFVVVTDTVWNRVKTVREKEVQRMYDIKREQMEKYYTLLVFFDKSKNAHFSKIVETGGGVVYNTHT